MLGKSLFANGGNEEAAIASGIDVNSYLQQIVRGAMIALAVIYDIKSKGKREKKKLGNITAKK